MELAFLPEEAEYTDSTERVLVASVISVTQNQLFLWILPTYPGTAEVTETANSAVSVTSAASVSSAYYSLHFFDILSPLCKWVFFIVL